VDVTESPLVDDEYFGEFYTGAQPAPPTTTSEIIATGAAVPGGTGTFTTFPQGQPSVRRSRRSWDWAAAARPESTREPSHPIRSFLPIRSSWPT